jgi:hypothetical protein
MTRNGPGLIAYENAQRPAEQGAQPAREVGFRGGASTSQAWSVAG